MTKEKFIWTILSLFFLFSLGYFFHQNFISEKSNITEEQTEQSLRELEETFNTEEIIVVFNDGLSQEEMETFLNEMGARIVDKQVELSTYVIQFKNTTSEKLLYLLDELNEQEEIAVAIFNTKTEQSDEELQFNDNTIESNKVFEAALSNYGESANVFYSIDGGFTFLYPTTWESSSEGLLNNQTEEKQVTYKSKKSAVDLYEDVVHNSIENEQENGFKLESELDVHERNHLIVVKWVMSNGEQTYSRALLQGEDEYYYFESNENVLPEEFNLIVDSFYIN